MKAKISVFVIFVEAITYFLLYNLHDCTFKEIKNNGSIEGKNSSKTGKKFYWDEPLKLSEVLFHYTKTTFSSRMSQFWR